MQTDIYLRSVDYTKAFDRVVHNKLVHFLDDLELDDKVLRLIQNLHYQHEAGIRINDTVSKIVPIKRGVRQGCVLSPDLYSLFSEIFMRTNKNLPGIGVGGVNVNNLRYADDTVLIAKNQEDLQALVTQLACVSKKFGMQINFKKTEVMDVSKKAQAPVCKILVDGSTLNQVENFKYLGCTISWACKDENEIKIRSAQAKAAFNQLRSVLCNKKMSFQCRYRVLNFYVHPIYIYCSETWTISKVIQDKICAFERWCLRRIQRISCTAKKSNAVVLRITCKQKSLLKEIKRRQLRFLGHVVLKGQLEALSLSGKIDGKKPRGKQRTLFLQQFPGRPNDIIHAARDGEKWKFFTNEAINVCQQI